jgi:septal ring factor EnvC (AmiA/AmiB activator)
VFWPNPPRPLLFLPLLACLAVCCHSTARAQDTAPQTPPASDATPGAQSGAATPDPNVKQLQGVEAALAATKQKQAALAAAAAALAKQTADLQASLVQRAAAVQAAEKELSQIEETLATLQDARQAKLAELADRRRALQGSLAALERLAMTPPGAALIDEDPLDIARGSLLLGYAVPELQRRAASLAGEVAQMDALGREIEGRRSRAQAVASTLEQDRQQVTELLKRKADLQRQTAGEASAAQARSEKLAAQAHDLHDLLEKLASEKPQTAAISRPAHVRPFPTQQASLVPPVAGQLVGHFGAPDAAAGSTAKGILLETRPGATVVAPFDGQVLFRGPFRSYGEILIIQHDGGYHSLLAGLARSDAVVGQWVLAGEPVGVMGPSQGGNPKLYMELRRDGHPIDPVPWLGKSDSKVE